MYSDSAVVDTPGLIDKVHPAVRILMVVVFVGGVAMADSRQLLSATFLLLIPYLLIGSHILKPALVMMRRMRWFFLSIVIIYAWFTPGQALILPFMSAAHDWMPTVQGIQEGLLRICSLVIIICTVNLLLICTSQNKLLLAVRYLARPLTLIGVSHDRLAVRAVLIIETLPEVQDLAREALAETRLSGRSFTKIGDVAARLLEQVITRAQDSPARSIQLKDDSSPPLYQWFYPVFLAALFMLVR